MRISVPTAGLCRVLVALLSLAACGGGDGGGTAPPAVASVAITAPAMAPSFQTLTRTVQFSAVARDAAMATIAGASIAWNSTNSAVATVSGTGLVTAVGNGTTQVSASAGGIASPAFAVTVAQVVAAVNVTPAAVAFGAIGSTRQLTAAVVDSSGATVPGAPAVTWTRAGTGATASVSAGGLAAALAVGASDTAVATAATKTGRAPISVTQVVASILVTSTGSDTLRTTGRTKGYAAVARDSQANIMGGVSISWSSSAPGVASVVAGSGLATALTDGTANIIASASPATGQRAITVRRFASTFTFSPPSATIVTPLGTQIFLGTVEDSVATALPITWTSRTTATLTLLATTGPQITARAAGNGTSYVVIQGGTRSDSALVTVSGQAVAPLTATVLVGGGNVFASQRNSTQNPAVDTIAVGGTITWQGQGGNHTAQSQGAPSFTSSGTLGTGTYNFTFNAVGTYQYDCAVHGGAMTGRIVVR